MGGERVEIFKVEKDMEGEKAASFRGIGICNEKEMVDYSF